MTSHPLLAAIPSDRLGDLLDTVPVGPGLITVTAIPAGEWGERAVIAWRPVGGTARVDAATTLHDPADVPHTVAEFTATLRYALDHMTTKGTTVPSTPMTPDRLAEIRNRNLDEVTAGPWLVADGSDGRPVIYVETLRDGRAGARVLLSADGATEADVQFVASARRSVPELLAEVDRLGKALSDAETRVAELEALKPARFQDCQVCGAGYEHGQPCTVCEYEKRVAAERAAVDRSVKSQFPVIAAFLAEDPCHPCGCPKRFDRHADGCAYSECPSCGAPADVTGQRIPEHRTGCPRDEATP